MAVQSQVPEISRRAERLRCRATRRGDSEEGTGDDGRMQVTGLRCERVPVEWEEKQMHSVLKKIFMEE
jgi:hypothetical protein